MRPHHAGAVPPAAVASEAARNHHSAYIVRVATGRGWGDDPRRRDLYKLGYSTSWPRRRKQHERTFAALGVPDGVQEVLLLEVVSGPHAEAALVAALAADGTVGATFVRAYGTECFLAASPGRVQRCALAALAPFLRGSDDDDDEDLLLLPPLPASSLAQAGEEVAGACKRQRVDDDDEDDVMAVDSSAEDDPAAEQPSRAETAPPLDVMLAALAFAREDARIAAGAAPVPLEELLPAFVAHVAAARPEQAASAARVKLAQLVRALKRVGRECVVAGVPCMRFPARAAPSASSPLEPAPAPVPNEVVERECRRFLQAQLVETRGFEASDGLAPIDALAAEAAAAGVPGAGERALVAVARKFFQGECAVDADGSACLAFTAMAKKRQLAREAAADELLEPDQGRDPWRRVVAAWLEQHLEPAPRNAAPLKLDAMYAAFCAGPNAPPRGPLLQDCGRAPEQAAQEGGRQHGTAARGFSHTAAERSNAPQQRVCGSGVEADQCDLMKFVNTPADFHPELCKY